MSNKLPEKNAAADAGVDAAAMVTTALSVARAHRPRDRDKPNGLIACGTRGHLLSRARILTQQYPVSQPMLRRQNGSVCVSRHKAVYRCLHRKRLRYPFLMPDRLCQGPTPLRRRSS